jgi:hypothetical protein
MIKSDEADAHAFERLWTCWTIPRTINPILPAGADRVQTTAVRQDCGQTPISFVEDSTDVNTVDFGIARSTDSFRLVRRLSNRPFRSIGMPACWGDRTITTCNLDQRYHDGTLWCARAQWASQSEPTYPLVLLADRSIAQFQHVENWRGGTIRNVGAP